MNKKILKKSVQKLDIDPTLKIKKMRGDGIVSVFSADHYIKEIDKLNENVKKAIELAGKNRSIITIGIVPTYPSIEFGYIKYDNSIKDKVYLIQDFKEKPTYEKAIAYLNSKQYLWNSGIFIWSTTCILKNFKDYLPDFYMLKEELYNAILTKNEDKVVKKVYKTVKSISIDKGVLEKSKNIEVIKSDFEWMDIGNINDYFKIYKKDFENSVALGNVVKKEINECNILNNTNELIVAVGVQNLNIIKCNGVCLIYDKDKIKNVSEIRKQLEEDKKYRKYI